MANDPSIEQFAKFLATVADPEDRKKFMRQATALAMNAATEEVLAEASAATAKGQP